MSKTVTHWLCIKWCLFAFEVPLYFAFKILDSKVHLTFLRANPGELLHKNETQEVRNEWEV